MVLPLLLTGPAVAPDLPVVDPVTEMTHAAPAQDARRHTVRTGETVSDIAVRHGVPVDAVVRRNHLGANAMVHPGQRLVIPSPSSGSPPAQKQSSSDRPRRTGPTRGYTVRTGDTLDGIARRHDMSVARLTALNDLDSSAHIHPGQRLRVHGSAARPAKRATSSAPRQSGGNTFAGRTYSNDIVSAADRNRHTLAQRAVPSRTQTRDRITTIARRHGVDPSLALAISSQESGWNQRKVSVANAIGTMQVIPSSGEWASQMAGRELDLLDTDDNITAGVLILKALSRMADSPQEAIAGYYQGLGSVQANGMYDDTRFYVKSVQALQRRV